jgi:hypothetical protein
MKRTGALLVVAGAFVPCARAVVNTRIDMQVTLTPENPGSWVSRISDIPAGSTVFARALVSFTGTGEPLGLASFVFQPTVGNAHATDTLLAFVNGGVGSNTSTPPGVVLPSQLNDSASFGRVSPWGRAATSSTSALRGFFHTNPNGDGIDYLRIAQTQATGWIGGQGNSTGGSGVNIAQLSDIGRTTSDPPFNSELANVYVFKFGIRLDSLPVSRTMVFDIPPDGFGNRNTMTGEREVYWWGNAIDDPSNRGTAIVVPAMVDVLAPAPGGCGLLLGLAGACGRRRRRPSTSAPSAPPRSP